MRDADISEVGGWFFARTDDVNIILGMRRFRKTFCIWGTELGWLKSISF
jgi:hypothetical protein